MSYHNTNTNLASSTGDIKEPENTNNSTSSQIDYFMAPHEFPFSNEVLDVGDDRGPKQQLAEFGRAEDYVELNIYNNNNDLITHIRDFRDFVFSQEGINTQTGFSNEIIINPSNTLNNLNFNAGNFKLEYRFQRKKIFNSFQKIFFIKEISNSRNEIKVQSNELDNLQLEQRYKIFEQEIQDSVFLKDFTLNFGNSINLLAINIALDKSGEKYSILIKLFEPLPSNLSVNSTFRIVEDLIQPVIYNSNVDAPPVEDGTIEILGPNYKIDTRLNNSIPSEFKTYDELLSGGVSSSYQNLTNALSSSFEPSVDYSNINTDSNYHFENFTHFGSATEKLNNFKYKLKLIELYDSQITTINTITGDASSSFPVIGNKQTIESKKNKVIGGFDGYERFLYFESGTYSWPKSNLIKPYVQRSITSSEALTWLGSDLSNSSYYGGQLFSSSKFDNQNIYNLEKIIPEYIKNNSDNDYYKLFTNMIGQHFDQSWLYIKSLTENKKSENHINKGIDKDLVYNTLKSLGIKVFDEFENADLFEYITGYKDLTHNKDLFSLNTTQSNNDHITTTITSSQADLDKLYAMTDGKRTSSPNYVLFSGPTNNPNFNIGKDITFDMGSILGYNPIITKVRFDFFSSNYVHNQVEILGSNDNVNFSSLGLEPLQDRENIQRTFTFNNNYPFKYYQLKFNENFDFARFLGIRELEFFSPYKDQFITFDSNNNELIPKADITKEKWKRIYHNLPYLLKTKGTERGIRALITSYGIPSTILNIKEFGGSTTDSTKYKTFSHDKAAYALKGDSNTDGYFIKTNWSSSLTDALSSSAKTVEFRIKPHRSNDNYHLFTLSGSHVSTNYDTNLILEPYIGNNISSSGDSTQYGRLTLKNSTTSETTSTNYFPIYNGDFWNIFAGIDITGNSNTTNAQVQFGAYQANHLKNINYITTSSYNAQTQIWSYTWGLTHTSDDALKRSGAQFAFIGGMPNGVTHVDIDGLRYSGSIQEVKYHFGELLSHDTLVKHALNPSMYSGNTISSSYNNVVLRLPLGSNLHKNSQSFHPNHNVNYLGDTTSNMTTQIWENITEIQHLTTPDTVGKSMTSEKVRIDNGEVKDNILSYNVKTETSTLDRQPLDTNDLGIYFSPSFEINKDIIYQLGSFRLDDYIGDPTHINENSYPNLKTLSDEYFKKNVNRYNYTDFIHSVKQFDHTLFKMIESMVPAKSNLKTGILIEPHYLERSKIGLRTALPTVTQHTHNATLDLNVDSNNSNLDLTAEYLSVEANYNLDENNLNFDSTINPLLNNIDNERISKKYFIALNVKHNPLH